MIIFQLLANGLITGCGYALVALGFAFIYGTTRIFHFAHGAVYTLSAYLFYTFYNLLNWPLSLSIAVSLLLTALCSILIDEVFYTPLVRRGASLFIQMLTSIGLYIVMVNLIAMFFQNETRILSPDAQPTYSIGIVILTRIQVATLASSFGLFGALVLLLKRTYLGKVIRAMRDDSTLVSAMGMNPQSIRRIVFALGSGLTGVSAILSGLDVGIDPHIGLAAFLNGAVAVIIGGVGFFEGAAIGGLFLGLLQNFAIWKISTRWQDSVTYIVLIIFLLFCAEGFMGKKRRTEEVNV